MRNENDVAMPILLITVAVALLFSGPSLAQISTIPATGMTSPLSAIGSPLNPAAIPLGAVELDPGGLTGSTVGIGNSSVSDSGCTNALAPSVLASSSEVAAATSALSTFDGGGMNATTSTSGTSFVNPTVSTASGTCNSTASSASSFGTTATPSMTTGTSSTSLGAAVGIPLGSSELGNLGVSSPIGIPTPALADPVTNPQVAIPTLNVSGTSCGSTGLTGMSRTPSTSGC